MYLEWSSYLQIESLAAGAAKLSEIWIEKISPFRRCERNFKNRVFVYLKVCCGRS